MRRGLAAAVALLAVLLVAPPASAQRANLHWPHKAGHYPAVVMVENHAANWRWHVHHATTLLHDEHMRYGPCVHGKPCVQVYGRNQGPNGYTGTTYPWVVGAKITWMRIVLNRYYAPGDTEGQLRQASLHELIHSLGLMHHIPGTCLSSVNNGDHAYSVAPIVRREIASIYAVVA